MQDIHSSIGSPIAEGSSSSLSSVSDASLTVVNTPVQSPVVPAENLKVRIVSEPEEPPKTVEEFEAWFEKQTSDPAIVRFLGKMKVED